MAENEEQVLYEKVELKKGVCFPLGKEGTWWRVLDVDWNVNEALVIAYESICQKAYHERSENITWENCTLRQWLNEKYYNKTFNKEEKEAILETELENPDNAEWHTKGGNSTRDKIFLLSIDEAKKYFENDEDRASGGWWWQLRSPGGNQGHAACIRSDGSVNYSANSFSNGGDPVRPALKINLESELFQSLLSKKTSGETVIRIPQVTIRNQVLVKVAPGAAYVELPEGVTEIGEKVFACRNELKEVKLPDSLRKIGKNAFNECRSLTSIVFPDSVTSIGEYAFNSCSSLTSVVIPESVTNIGSSAFSGCSSLTSIVIPEGMTNIGDKTFYKCSNLTSVVIPDSVTSIGEYAFDDCSSLTSVIIPDSVTGIGNGTFYECSSLISVNIPNSVTSIGNWAFYSCSSLTDIVIPDSVTSIGEYAFDGCSSLTSIEIPESVTSIGAHAFYACSSLTSIKIPDGVTSIGGGAFSGCSSLTNISIPDGVTSIVNYMFYGCSSLTSINIPDGVTSIGDKAFSGCSSLTSIVIPAGVTSLSDNVFADCEHLEFLKFLADNPELKNSLFRGFERLHICTKNISDVPVKLRQNAVIGFAEDEEYSDVNRESYFKYIKSNAVKLTDAAKEHPALLSLMCREKLIAPRDLEAFTAAIQNSGNAEAIAMMLEYNNNVSKKDKEKAEKAKEKQEDEVFDRMIERQNKAGIEGLNIAVTGALYTIGNREELKKYIESKGGKLVGSISSKVDYLIMNEEDSDNERRKKCENLGIEIIDEYRFNDLAGRIFEIENGVLTKYNGNGRDVVIPDGVTSIGDKAFFYRRRLTSIVIPESVTSIGDEAFSFCSNLTSIEIPDGVTSIGNWAFSSCENLSSIEIPDNMTSIGKDAFSFCSNLTSIEIPKSVTSIGNSTFQGCSSLTSIEIPESVTSIGDGAFYDCSSLTNISIPDGVTSIENYMFYGCSSLTSIVIPASVTSIGDKAFYSCSSLTDIVIPKSVTSIGDAAFSYCSSLTSIEIPESVTSIGDSAFERCSTLTSIVIPDGVTEIGRSAFQGCNRLKSINIPDSVIAVGNYAFSGCDQLNRLHAPFSLLADSREKILGVLTFMEEMDLYSSEEQKKYIKYISSQKKKILPEILKNDDVKALYFFSDSGKITKQNINDDFLNPAILEKATQCITFLMSWKEKNITPEYLETGFTFSRVSSIDFSGKIYVLTGFDEAEEGKLTERIVSNGGIVKSSVVMATDYLIVNERYDHQTTKYKRAIELIEKGKSIKIISKAMFDKL